MRASAASHSVSSQPLLIPRAENRIAKTIARLRTASFSQDSLMSASESFMVSIWCSAMKRDGAVIEAAIMDAIEQTPSLQLIPVSRVKHRHVDVQFAQVANGHIVALEIKRGSLHDSTKIRQFRNDLIEMPEILKAALPLFQIKHLNFHIVFVSGTPPIREGLTLSSLKKIYGLDATLHVDAARRRFSREVRSVIEERTK
jgi:hypothetical protein